ncbi:THAP domain-containing protein [Elysia marginata]|uniref:THAP domain-containing protein n=1 Tax=Elysia marginata TaxID=1093978 RepID=A0AAV4HN88_9GAST|nr:THAP domain-containing protein [Elysia marginata]
MTRHYVANDDGSRSLEVEETVAKQTEQTSEQSSATLPTAPPLQPSKKERRKNKLQLEPHEVEKTRRVANVRIHVGRAMERIKNFKILQGVMPMRVSSYASDIFKQNVDAMLTWTEASHNWTNNNCKNKNHVLRMKIQWQPQAMPQLIDSIHEIVKGHYNDVEVRAIMRCEEYRLHKALKNILCSQQYGAPRLMNNDNFT